jgi:hypothetical protein
MLGPFPFSHHDTGLNVGTSNIINPSHHSMTNYIIACGRKPWSGIAVPTSDNYVKVGLSWMFRQLQKLLLHAVTLGLGVVFMGAVTIADVLYALIQVGKSMGNAVIAFLRKMASFVKNGWEAASAKANDNYYKAKEVIFHIISLFLAQIGQAARQSLTTANKVVGAGVSAAKQIAPILGQSAAMSLGLPVPPIFYL